VTVVTADIHDVYGTLYVHIACISIPSQTLDLGTASSLSSTVDRQSQHAALHIAERHPIKLA